MGPRRTVLAVVVSLVAALAAAAPATAGLPTHAQLVSTDPADGATRDTVSEVTISFSEDVNEKFVQVQVSGPGGDEADGAPVVDGHDVTQALPPDLPSGEHTVVYRVVSVDGHPVSGTFSFTTTGGPGDSASDTTGTTAAATSPPAVSSPDPSVSAAPTSTGSEGAPAWLVPTLVGLVVLVLLAGGLLLARPRREGDDTGPDGVDDEAR